MARKVDRMPLKSGGKYPWEQWFDGSIWELTAGDDFMCHCGTLASSAKAAAETRGVKVQVIQCGDKIYIQAQV